MGQENEKTRVDLGEDLLEETKVLEVPPSPESSKEEQTFETLFERAVILFNEKFYDDAKKTFRKILRLNPQEVNAKKYLEEIQKIEIQQLLSLDSSQKKLSISGEEIFSPREVLSKLDHDLNLGIEKSELKVIPDLFKTQQHYKEYREQLIKKIIGLQPKERTDVGIAHLEMGLYDAAIDIFETVVRYQEFFLSGSYLLALALINAGSPLQATIKIEPILRDVTVSEKEKVDFLYLMGIAFEKLNDKKRAKDFFKIVIKIDPKYKDVFERITELS